MAKSSVDDYSVAALLPWVAALLTRILSAFCFYDTHFLHIMFRRILPGGRLASAYLYHLGAPTVRYRQFFAMGGWVCDSFACANRCLWERPSFGMGAGSVEKVLACYRGGFLLVEIYRGRCMMCILICGAIYQFYNLLYHSFDSS